MYYSLCVAADFHGAKVNMQFFFDKPTGPTVAQVLTRATEAFNVFFRSKGLTQPFSITTAVIFNEANQTWDRLERTSQLVHNGQIYLFQPDVVDLPAEIPDPINGMEYLVDYVSPQRTPGRSTSALADASPKRPLPATFDPYQHTYRPSPAEEEYAYAQRQTQPPLQYDYTGGYNPYQGQSGAGGGIGSSSPSVYYETDALVTSAGIINRASSAAINPFEGAVDETKEMIKAFHEKAYHTPPRGYRGEEGVSIIQDEREKLEALEKLPLDEFRETVKKEAREFSGSPARDHSRYNENIAKINFEEETKLEVEAQ